MQGVMLNNYVLMLTKVYFFKHSSETDHILSH